MATLPMFPLPLPDEPPPGYSYSGHSLSLLASSTTSVSQTVLNRDTFRGAPSCIVCGSCTPPAVQVYRIIMSSELDVWDDLKKRKWIPSQAKKAPKQEPRNCLSMCANHGALFNQYCFFIRYIPEISRFVVINYIGLECLQQYHGKAVAIDIHHPYAPFPTLFIIHEMRVRGCHPLLPTEPMMPDDITWQDWISSSGIYDSTSDSIIRDGTGRNHKEAQTASGSGHTLDLKTEVIADV